MFVHDSTEHSQFQSLFGIHADTSLTVVHLTMFVHDSTEHSNFQSLFGIQSDTSLTVVH